MDRLLYFPSLKRSILNIRFLAAFPLFTRSSVEDFSLPSLHLDVAFFRSPFTRRPPERFLHSFFFFFQVQILSFPSRF